MKVFSWLLKHLGWIFLCIFITWFVWNIKPTPKPDTVIEYKTKLVLDSILKDSLVREANHWYDKFWITKKAYDLLFEEWKQIKPDTVFISDTIETFVIDWEWIIKIHRTAEMCSVWTFKIDSLLLKGDLETIKKDILSLKQLKKLTDSLVSPDSVVGRVKLYPLKFKEQEFILTSQRNNLFIKVKKETPFSLLFGAGIGYNLMGTDLKPYTSDIILGWDRFSERIYTELWYKDKAKLHLGYYFDKGFITYFDINFLRLGKIKR